MDYNKLFDMTGKVCIVTGGMGYLGSQVAKCLKDFGATVVVADIREREDRWEKKAEDLGYDDKAIYELIKYAPGDQAMIRKSGSKGRAYTVPLDRLHLIRKGGKKKRKEPAKRQNSKR